MLRSRSRAKMSFSDRLRARASVIEAANVRVDEVPRALDDQARSVVESPSRSSSLAHRDPKSCTLRDVSRVPANDAFIMYVTAQSAAPQASLNRVAEDCDVQRILCLKKMCS